MCVCVCVCVCVLGIIGFLEHHHLSCLSEGRVGKEKGGKRVYAGREGGRQIGRGGQGREGQGRRREGKEYKQTGKEAGR